MYHLLRRLCTAADADQGTGDDAYHVVEKTIAGDLYDDHVRIISGDCEIIDMTRPVGNTRLQRAEAGEVMLSDERLCCLLHGTDIQGIVIEVAVEPSRGIREVTVEDLIPVGLYRALKARMPV